jgi:hypothetical protein
VLAYTLPAVAVWWLAGLLLNVAPVAGVALALIVGYGAYYGFIEAAGRPGLPAPGRTWQVPARWVDGAPAWRKVLVWGTLLGPGFATRNPYAGFGLLPLAVAAIGRPLLGGALAALLGLLHGMTRAVALFREVRRHDQDYLSSVARSLRWRALDGAALLAVSAAAGVLIVARG